MISVVPIARLSISLFRKAGRLSNGCDLCSNCRIALRLLRIRVVNLTGSLWRQTDAPQQINKARISAHGVEGPVNPQSGELIGALLKGLVQPGQRLCGLAQSGVDPGDVDRRDVALLCDLSQLRQRPPRLITTSGYGIGVSQIRDEVRIRLARDGLDQCGDGLGMLASL